MIKSPFRDPLESINKDLERLNDLARPKIPTPSALSQEFDAPRALLRELNAPGDSIKRNIKRNVEWLNDLGRPTIPASSAFLRELDALNAFFRENSATKLLNRVLKQTTMKSI